MPDKTPGERLTEDFGKINHVEMANRINTLLAEQSAGMVLDLMTVRKMQAGKISKGEFVPENWYSEAELLDAIRKQLPNVKLIT